MRINPVKVRLAAGLLLLLLLAVPMPMRIVPTWSLRVVDIAGVPQANVKTVQTWRHPLLQPEQGEETRTSDAQGRVVFAERTAWGNGLLSLYRALDVIFTAGTGATFGPDVWVVARKDVNTGGSDFYLPGRTPPETVIMRMDGVCPADAVAPNSAAAVQSSAAAR